MIKGIIAMSLLITCIILLIFRAKKLYIIKSSGNGTNVNINGRKYDIILDGENITLVSNTRKNKFNVVLDLEGNAQISSCDSKGNTKRASMKIDEMTENNLEAVITYDDGTKNRYNSIGDLKVNKYSGRGLFYIGLTETAIAVGVSDVVIKALLLSGVIVVGGITYVQLDIALRKNKIKQDRYYRAYRSKDENMVFVAPFALSFKEAKMRVLAKMDVYTYKDEVAKNLASEVSGDFIGPEIHNKKVYKNGVLKNKKGI